MAVPRSKILNRLAVETGVPGLKSVLGEDLSASDLQSLQLSVYQARVAKLAESDLMAGSDRALLTPSGVDARVLNAFDRAAFGVARDFEAVELSPVARLGLNRVLGEIDQNNVLTTIRNAEVSGDPTPVMALECARRRRDPKIRGSEAIRLCASQRVIRLQPFDVPGYTPHFRLFALVSAGRDGGAHGFEIEHLREHVRFYLELCRELSKSGFSLANPRVEISDAQVILEMLAKSGVALEELRTAVRAHRLGESARFLAERGVSLPSDIRDPASEIAGISRQHRLARVKANIFDTLAREFPEAEFSFNLARLEGLGYYGGLCLRISPAAPDGQRYPVVDGGFTNWTARLLQDRKERLLATGIGSEFVCARYRAAE